MFEDENELRIVVALSLQSALVGRVSPNLRAVAAGWDLARRTVRIRCYFDGPISEDDIDRMVDVQIEVYAQFSDDYRVELETERHDAPLSLGGKGLQRWAYMRLEPSQANA
jgi:hypothetical protein